MLSSLTIKNVVLIDSLHLEGLEGLCALTGETGAGKSILLDALGLALGARADSGIVRHGEEQASVSACFDIHALPHVQVALRDKGVDAGDEAILRRTVSKDGRSKAFINDQPVSVQTLKETGALLVEIHGQFETQGLLDSATHRATLDDTAGLSRAVSDIRQSWTAWRAAQMQLEETLASIATARMQEQYLRHAAEELAALSPALGEEATLASKRSYLMNVEKLRDGFAQAANMLEKEDGILDMTGSLQSLLEKISYAAGNALTPVIDSLSRARAEMEDVAFRIGHLQSEDGAQESLEDVEERYFALKECARKHRCTPDDLPRVQEELTQKLRLAESRDEAVSALEKDIAAKREDYISKAARISAQREKAAKKLARAVQAELPDLKLDKATFHVECEKMDEEHWGPDGFDRVQFLVSTNPQTPAGSLRKIASGGELARFLLALKAATMGTTRVPTIGTVGISTMIFDEVDSGIGGATAEAVGERLARLGRDRQVLVVTHSPQVAAAASHHWRVEKSDQKGKIVTRITPLSSIKDRQEEIARMLSGAVITKEARAQAAKLLGTRDAA